MLFWFLFTTLSLYFMGEFQRRKYIRKKLSINAKAPGKSQNLQIVVDLFNDEDISDYPGIVLVTN